MHARAVSGYARSRVSNSCMCAALAGTALPTQDRHAVATWAAQRECQDGPLPCHPASSCQHSLAPLPTAPPHFSGAVRLVNGSSASSGRVEMLRDGQWVPMSRNGNVRDGQAAATVCRQLGYTGDGVPVAEPSQTFGPGRNASSLVVTYCTGDEVSLHACRCYGAWDPACSTAELRSSDGNALAVTCPAGTGGWTERRQCLGCLAVQGRHCEKVGGPLAGDVGVRAS